MMKFNSKLDASLKSKDATLEAYIRLQSEASHIHNGTIQNQINSAIQHLKSMAEGSNRWNDYAKIYESLRKAVVEGYNKK